MRRAALLLTVLTLALAPVSALAQSSSLNPPASVQATSAAASNLIVSGPHLLLGFHVTPTVAGYVMIFDATSAPADGTVSPLGCFGVPAPASAGLSSTLSMANTPLATTAQNGIAVVFSTTGCFTLTKSSTAYISVLYQ